jgi:hypothetical protein
MHQYYYKTERRNKWLSEKPITIITFVICLICWGINCFYSTEFPTNSINKILKNKEIAYTIGLLAVLMIGFGIQRINDIEMFTGKRTPWPFTFFFLFFSTNVDLQPLSKAIIVLFCFVAFLYEMFKSYQMPEATINFFNASVYLGFASLFVPQILFFVLLMWNGMYNFRALELKGFLASLIGVMTIYWILLAWCVWMHDFSVYTQWFNELININFFPLKSLLQYHKPVLPCVLILTIISCFYIKMESSGNSVHIRMIQSFLINFSILSVILIFLYGDQVDLFQEVLYLPASMLIAHFFKTVKHRIMFILYYLILILLLFSFITNVWNS